MNRIYICILLVVLSGGYIFSQNSLSAILEQVEENNLALQSARQLATVQKIDAKTGIYPSDINVEYEYLFGNQRTDYQRESELTVSQDFDFPTTYFQKNKISNMMSEQADIQYKITRQEILLEAKQLCIELVYFNKMKDILAIRLKNAEDIHQSYQKRLAIGDANALETNKIALELLNVNTEFSLNEVEIVNRLKKLEELNGGIPVVFTDKTYFEANILYSFEEIIDKTLEVNPELQNLMQEKKIASQSVSLAKSMSLPKISVGYRMNVSNPEKYHGFVAGISVPLWENKNTVKRAKAQTVLADMEIDNSRLNQVNEVMQLFDRAKILQESTNNYRQLISSQDNNELLYKALSLGQISLLEYLTEVNFLYQSTEYFLQTERDYHLVIAQIYKFVL